MSAAPRHDYDNPRTQANMRWYKKALEDVATVLPHTGVDWDTSERVLVFYAAVFGGPPDHDNEIIEPGAFTGWYRRWRSDPEKMYPATGGKLLVIESHNWHNLDKVIGWAGVGDVTIDTHGLLIGAHMFDWPESKRAWEMARTPEQGGTGIGVGASFAFSVAPGRAGSYVDKSGVRHITSFSEVMEVGPCALGSNPRAGSVGVKEFDRLVAEFKSIEQKVAMHPAMLVRDIERSVAKARAKQAVKAAEALEPDWTRCNTCGAFLNGWSGTEVEAEMVDGTVSQLGHIRYAQCGKCGTWNLNAAKSAQAQVSANDLAKVIGTHVRGRKLYETASRKYQDAADDEYTHWDAAKRAAFEAKANANPYTAVQAEARVWLGTLDDDTPTVKSTRRADVDALLASIDETLKEFR